MALRVLKDFSPNIRPTNWPKTVRKTGSHLQNTSLKLLPKNPKLRINQSQEGSDLHQTLHLSYFQFVFCFFSSNIFLATGRQPGGFPENSLYFCLIKIRRWKGGGYMISTILEIMYPPFNLLIFIRQKYKEFPGNPPGCLPVASLRLVSFWAASYRAPVRSLSKKYRGSKQRKTTKK